MMYKLRKFTILLVILGGTMSQDFNLFDTSYDVFAQLADLDDYGLDNTTESGLSLEVEESILHIKSMVCSQEGDCSELLGCNCDKQFKKLGKKLGAPCRDLPCRFVDYFLENGANMIRDLSHVSSFSTLMRWFSGYYFPILQEFVCKCSPNLIDTVANCALGYDSEFVGHEVQEMVRNFVLKLGKKDLKRALLLPSNMFCVDNESCVGEFAQTLIDIGSMWDNSTNPNPMILWNPPIVGTPLLDMNECYNFRRLSDKILEHVYPMWNWNGDAVGFRLNPTYDEVLTMIDGIADEFWCGKFQCAGHLDSTFNTCCAAKASSMMGEKELQSVLKLIDVAHDDITIDFSTASEKLKKKVRQTLKPEELCEELYKKKTCE